MFQVRQTQTGFQKTWAFFELLFHSIVRDVRKSGGNNALLGLVGSMVQTLTFVAAFFIMFSILGMRGAALRGDFLLYIMSGIFLFLTHTKTVGAVSGADGPTAPMMKHAPMNTLIAVLSTALSTLYTQVLSLVVVLFGYHVISKPVVIEDMTGAFGMFLIAWFTGCGVGMVLLAIKPWAPGFVTLASTIYQRGNMIASGKMFVANTLPGFMIAMFDWNPLFHSIDQARGFMFINYSPHHSSITYPLYLGITLVMIGLIGEHFTRRHASESWGSRGL